ncbi:MlaD family protein [Psychroflexus aestuariivivens]|uniref:MlaD family protein n=1 Tax=Psychroflexus aestuariivivens TaxID=1795040 RepID=UPI000FDC1434|nr:MlaD family protein [Psychroflexus aestuariivivens]
MKKELKAGILAIVALAMLIFGYNYLKGSNLFDSSRVFYAIYDDVEGLSASAPITINGYQVGNVSDISFIDNTGKLIVTLSIDHDFQFSESSEAKIYGGGLIGGKTMTIVPDIGNKEMAQPGDTLQSSVDEGLIELVNEKLSPLKDKIERAVVSIDTLVSSVNFILDSETKSSVKTSFAELNETLQSLNKASQEIEKVVGSNSENIDKTFQNFKKTSDNLVKVSDTLSQIEFNRIVSNAEETVLRFKKISEKLDNGEGSMGKLLNDEKLYTNLEKATKELEELLRDIKENPKRYVHFSVFGKNSVKYKDSE